MHIDPRPTQVRTRFSLGLLPVETPVQLLRNQTAQHLLYTHNMQRPQKPFPDFLNTLTLRRTHATHDPGNLLQHQSGQARRLLLPQPSIVVPLLPLPPPTIVANSLQPLQETRGHLSILARPRVRLTKPVPPQSRRGLREQPQLEATTRPEIRLVLRLLKHVPAWKVLLED